jgi:hypothetical protein
MSRALSLAIFLWTLAPNAWAQDTMMTRLRSRADSLLQAWRNAQALANFSDSLERERATVARDTIAVGHLRIIANQSPLPLREAAERVWPAIDSLYGGAAAELVHYPYIIRAVDPDTALRRSSLHVGMEVPWDLDLRSTTTLLLTSLPIAPLDPPLAEWLGMPLRPSVYPEDERRAVYVQLVTAPSQAVRACFLGMLARCADVLALGDTSGLLERWYPSPAERRALVTESFRDFFNHGANALAFQACLALSDAACTGLLRSLPAGTLSRPLGPAARATMVREALRLGGRDAYRRLLESDATIGERLAAAAGVGLDSLVGAWRSAIVAARPPAVALPWWAIGTAFGWLTLFAACGLRSSRWRL